MSFLPPKVAAVEPKKACCFKSATVKSAEQRDDNEAVIQKNDSTKTETVYKCCCPCGKGKLLSLSGVGSNELIPITSNKWITLQPVETLYVGLSLSMASRHSEPPDPPPRLTPIS